MCPQVKERLQIRPGDSEEEVRKRLSNYNAYTEELDDYYGDTAQHVNADQDPHTVFESIESMIVNPIPKQFV
jgi:adenylate kinase